MTENADRARELADYLEDTFPDVDAWVVESRPDGSDVGVRVDGDIPSDVLGVLYRYQADVTVSGLRYEYVEMTAHL